MTDRDGIFAGDDPFVLAQAWLDAASQTEPNDPNAMSLATVDSAGLPNCRIVLLKGIEPDGFVFFTNYDSQKGQEIAATGQAALNLHWKTLGRQIRVRGQIAKVPAAVSDEYYATRPLGSRIGAWASKQSQPLKTKNDLVTAVSQAGAVHGENPKRPLHWGGYKVVPSQIEFWANGEFRLHDRFNWHRTRISDDWSIQRLNP